MQNLGDGNYQPLKFWGSALPAEYSTVQEAGKALEEIAWLYSIDVSKIFIKKLP